MRYNGALWRGPTVNMTPGGMLGHIGLVLHIQQGTEAGTDSWFKNPAAQVSAHFGNPKTGQLEQWVDTDDRAWAEVAGNPYWISVENEGYSGDSLTASQLENAAELLAWAHATYNVPLQISDNPGAGIGGLTGHGLGGAAWGGHIDCPGTPILGQRQAIITRAAQIAGAPIPGGSTVANFPQPDVTAMAAAAGVNLAGKFTAGQDVDGDHCAFYADVRAEIAVQLLQKLLARSAAPVVDVDALAAAIAPHLTAAATADQIAHAVVMHLGADLQAG